MTDKLREALQELAIIPEYDMPGDSPVLCGYSCQICKEESDRPETIDHRPECALSLPTSDEGTQALATRLAQEAGIAMGYADGQHAQDDDDYWVEGGRDKEHDEIIKNTILEAIATLQSQATTQAIPDGFVLVRKEPTREMLNAAVDVDSFKLGDISPLGFRISPQQLFKQCFAAMLAASPSPPEAAKQESSDDDHWGHKA